MSDKMVGYTKFETSAGVTMAEGERLLITIMPAGSTLVAGSVVYDGYVPQFMGFSGAVNVDAVLYSFAPVIVSMTADDYTILPGGTSRITVMADDPYDLPISYEWTISGGTFANVSDGVIDWTAPAEIGTFSVSCKVLNSQLAFTTAAVEIDAYSVPTINSLTSTPPSPVVTGQTVVIDCTATDAYIPDPHDLYYSWIATGGVYSLNDVHSLSWTAPSMAGVYTITVMVSEAKGVDGVEQSIDVTVV